MSSHPSLHQASHLNSRLSQRRLAHLVWSSQVCDCCYLPLILVFSRAVRLSSAVGAAIEQNFHIPLWKYLQLEYRFRRWCTYTRLVLRDSCCCMQLRIERKTVSVVRNAGGNPPVCPAAPTLCSALSEKGDGLVPGACVPRVLAIVSGKLTQLPRGVTLGKRYRKLVSAFSGQFLACR